MATEAELRRRNIARLSSVDDKPHSENDEKTSGKREDFDDEIYGISHLLGIALLISALLYTIHTYTTFLPLSKPLDSELTEFSGDRARKHLESITSIGPRPSGSYANDIEAVRYILDELNSIKENANSEYHIEIDVQTASGTFAFFRKSSYINLGFTSTYDNITNVIVKIAPEKSTEVFVLANAHYDTVMNTEGASDDTVSCAVLIETFRAISVSFPADLKHGIIFLFNGAEEGGLSGSHGFIQHRWFSLVRALVNLEAAGSGGREFVFQTGPDHPWILDTYATSAKYPYASIVAQEIFQAGLVPSDTDFRVFVDYGGLVGVDIAFVNNGYVYHTRHDNAKAIPSGSIQRAGDNVHGLLKAMANSAYLENPGLYKHGSSVFFDVLGLFVVHYPERLHSVMNNLTCLVVVVYFIRRFTRQRIGRGNIHVPYAVPVSLPSLFLSTLTILFAWVLAFIAPVALAFLLMKLRVLMTWFSYPKFGLLLYGAPALFGMLLGHCIGNKLIRKVCSPSTLSFIYGHLVIYSSVLCYLNYKGLLSSFLVWLWVVFPFMASLVIDQISSLPSRNLFAYLLVLVALTPPSLITMYHLDTLFVFFGAHLGRVGTELPSEVIIAVISAASVVIVLTYLMSIYHNAVGRKQFLYFSGICSVVIFSYSLTGRMQPYSGVNPVTPKRLWLQHTLRTFNGANGSVLRQDSGLWIQPQDAIGFHTFEKLDFFKKAEKFQCDGSYCGLPYYYPMRKIIKEHWYLRSEKPDGDFEPLTSNIYERIDRPNGAVRFNFEITGPDHMNLFLTLKNNVTLDWSMYKSQDGHIYAMNDEVGGEAHIVFYSHGYYSNSWKFWMEFQSGSPSAELAELGIARHYLHGKNSRTKLLNSALSTLPDWICDNTWASNYDSFTLQ